jgi:FMN-dependent NADH-azoreductase
MKKLLHIIATPRGSDSRTLKVSKAFLEAFTKRHPEFNIDELNLFEETLPELSVKSIEGKYVLLGGGDLPKELKDSWRDIVAHIERFLSADLYLVSTPMWNFNIPYCLKRYNDIIVQPKYLFQYTSGGPQGLVKGKKMIILTSRGGDYSPKTPYQPYDFQEPYLRAIFGFVGITDITFINAQPMDALGLDVQKEKIEEAKIAAVKIAAKI